MVSVVWSPKGGSGASTIVAKTVPYIRKKTIVADFNYVEPSLALYLELPARACNMSDVLRKIRAHEKLKVYSLTDFVDVVAVEDILYLRNYSGYDVEDFIDYMNDKNIILDVPSFFNDSVTINAIKKADICCVVCNRTPVSVAITSKAILLLERLKLASALVLLVSPIGNVSLSEIYELTKKKPFEVPLVNKKGWETIASIFG